MNPDSKKYDVAIAMNGSVNQGSFKARYERGEGKAEFKDCPGCKKCDQHGGYVLRRGSWRPTSSYEPILMLAKSDKYFCDGEPVKTPPAKATVKRDQYTRILDDPEEQFAVQHDHETVCSGANLRDVWNIPAEPLSTTLCRDCGWMGTLPPSRKAEKGKRVCRQCKSGNISKHYAAFPSELVHRCLACSTSAKGYCVECGGPWVRVVQGGKFIGDLNPKLDEMANRTSWSGREWAEHHQENPTTTIGWRPSCSCPEQPPRPAKVLDPFCGSGRTGIEAIRMGLDFVGCELNEEYAGMADRLLREENPLFSGVLA